MNERVLEIMALKLAQAEASNAMLQAEFEDVKKELRALQAYKNDMNATESRRDVTQQMMEDILSN